MMEFMDQINHCLSLRFKEKWRHKYSANFISLFQERVLKALDTQKPLKKSTLYTLYTKKHKYNPDVVFDFFKEIDISLYYPVIFDDDKFFLIRKEYRKSKER